MRSNAFTKTLILQQAFAALLFFVFFSFQPIKSEAKQTTEYQIKAGFLYNFTQFIEWPPDAFSSINSPFIIGIIGENPFGTYIEELVEGEKIKDHPIVVRYYEEVEEVLECQVLFINIHETEKVKQILTTIGNRSILTVSDSSSFVRSGGMVGFYKEENKIRFEINSASLKSAQLSVSSKLLSVSRIFDPRGE